MLKDARHHDQLATYLLGLAPCRMLSVDLCKQMSLEMY